MLSSLLSTPSGSATLPRRGNSGKSEGVFLGPSKAGCRLIRVNVEADLGSTFCGKPIGRGGNKMCLQKHCVVATHLERSYPTCFTSNDVVLIQSQNGREAFLKPAVKASKLQPNLAVSAGGAHQGSLGVSLNQSQQDRERNLRGDGQLRKQSQ
mmetsp:Transcript_5676/g.8728  ORF Transcript_5676/g.8728 Transcript_5676/m.8728 type:complete len:153 (+) Transcript_5676:40-498(+)